MLLAAKESAVTKKPRLRLIMRRSSSVRPLGSFHKAMSRVMLTSCGIQWLAQDARYFSHAHLYLKGTSWFTSVLPLMMRLSAARTRWGATSVCGGVAADGTRAPSSNVRTAGVPCTAATGALADGVCKKFNCDDGLTSSSQVNICISNLRIMRAAKRNEKQSCDSLRICVAQ